MVATFFFAEANGSPTTGSLLWAGSVSQLNLGNIDGSLITTASNPITAGNNSYEKWFVGSWSGTFTKVSNLQFWQSAGSSGTGETMFWTGSAHSRNFTGSNPTASASVYAVGSIPTSDPGTANVGFGSPSSLTGSITATGSSNFIVVQLKTTASANPGPVNQKTWTLEWDEQ